MPDYHSAATERGISRKTSAAGSGFSQVIYCTKELRISETVHFMYCIVHPFRSIHSIKYLHKKFGKFELRPCLRYPLYEKTCLACFIACARWPRLRLEPMAEISITADCPDLHWVPAATCWTADHTPLPHCWKDEAPMQFHSPSLEQAVPAVIAVPEPVGVVLESVGGVTEGDTSEIVSAGAEAAAEDTATVDVVVTATVVVEVVVGAAATGATVGVGSTAAAVVAGGEAGTGAEVSGSLAWTAPLKRASRIGAMPTSAFEHPVSPCAQPTTRFATSEA